MRVKIEKVTHVLMFEGIGEFYAHEVTYEKAKRGFFICPSCEVGVHYKYDHFFSRNINEIVPM